VSCSAASLAVVVAVIAAHFGIGPTSFPRNWNSDPNDRQERQRGGDDGDKDAPSFFFVGTKPERENGMSSGTRPSRVDSNNVNEDGDDKKNVDRVDDASCFPEQTLHVIHEIQRAETTSDAAAEVVVVKKFTEFLEGPGLMQQQQQQQQAQRLKTNRSAGAEMEKRVCRFFATEQSKHFPHAMQQLYRCWSWWVAEAVDNNTTTTMTLQSSTSSPPLPAAVLFGPSDHRGFRTPAENVQRHDFFTQILGRMAKRLPLEIRTINTTAASTSPNKLGTGDSRGNNDIIASKWVQSNFVHGDNFAMRTPNDASLLRRILFPEFYGSRDVTSSVNASSKPRIAILNRDRRTSKRSILNADDVAAELASESSNGYVPVVYFETNHSLARQIEFYSATDVLISSHGAQLTGVPFMGSGPCSVVLELFPKGYAAPYYFGSLARSSGMSYRALYLSGGDSGDNGSDSGKNWEYESRTFNVAQRIRLRKQNLCPDVAGLVQVARQAIGEWRNCRLQG